MNERMQVFYEALQRDLEAEYGSKIKPGLLFHVVVEEIAERREKLIRERLRSLSLENLKDLRDGCYDKTQTEGTSCDEGAGEGRGGTPCGDPPDSADRYDPGSAGNPAETGRIAEDADSQALCREGLDDKADSSRASHGRPSSPARNNANSKGTPKSAQKRSR